MKNFRLLNITLLYIFIASTVLAQQEDHQQLLQEARETLPRAFQDEKVCDALLGKLKDVKNPEPILKGYVGAAYIARSKHAPLLDKRSALKTGATMLEEAIKEKPNTLELLFLRMTIQVNLPGFLGYDDSIDSDKKFVFDNFRSAPPTLQKRIANFITKNDYFTEEEKKLVQ